MNFRHHQPRPFGNRGSDMLNPWMTEEEMAGFRRQPPQFPSPMQNMNPNMHSPLLNSPGLLSTPNKGYMNQNSCKMSSSNFSHAPNPDIFKPSHSMNEISYPNRFMDDRFPSSSYPHMNLQHKMQEPLIKDFPTSNMMSPQTHKSGGFSDVSKPLLPNVRQPLERLSCMQNDQAQFQKYGNSPVFQGKRFPFPNKEPLLQNTLFNERIPGSVESSLSPHKPNFKVPNLFPAYTPKDNSESPFQKSQNMQEESVKNIHSSAYSADFVGKSTNLYNKTPLSPRYSKSSEPFHEKTESHQERNVAVNDVFNKSPFLNDSQPLRAMPNSPLLQDSFKTTTPQVSQDSFKTTTPQVSQDSFKTMTPQVSQDPFKTMPNSQVSQDSFKTVHNSQASHDPFKNVPNLQVSRESFKAMPNSEVSHDSFKTMSNPEVSHDSLKTMPSTVVSHDSFKTLPSPVVSQDSFKAMPNTVVSNDSFKTIPNPVVSHDSLRTMSSPVVSHDSFKTMPNPVSHDSFKTMPNPVSHDSFKTLESKLSSSNTKYPFSSENQQSCFQSSNEMLFQTSQSMSVSNHSNTTASRDCLMQNTLFSSQSGDNQNTKETFSTFNFESNISSADIADLLPGLDAFLKETLNKSEEIVNKPEEDTSKNDFSKSTVPGCAFSDDEWSKHSIPFIGDNPVSSNNNRTDFMKESFSDQVPGRERDDKFQLPSEKTANVKLTDINQSNNNLAKQNQEKNIAFENEPPAKVRSALEEAIDLLVTTDPIVGLDYIIEYKKNLSQQGSFPFRCKLCNSGITRPSIIDHIIGSKHRMRYLKAKNDLLYESIISLKVEKSEKESKIAEAAFHMERVFGRGSVTVNTTESPKVLGLGVESSWKEATEGIEDPVFTLDKIPTIGFEALSPQLDEISSADFSLEPDLNHAKQDTSNIIQKENLNAPLSAASTEVKKEVLGCSNSDTLLAVPGLDSELSSCTINSSETPAVLGNNLKSDVSKTLVEESSVEVHPNSESCQVKRNASPESPCQTKKIKIEDNDESKPCSDMLTAHESMDITTEDPEDEKKEFKLDILDMFPKSEISSEEEASVVLKVIGMLMQMYLRYKLHHLPIEKVENVMKLLNTTSPVNIEELKSLLKDNKKLEETEEPLHNNTTQPNEEKLEQNLSNNVRSNDSNCCEPSGSMNNLNNSELKSGPASSIMQPPVPNMSQNSDTSGLSAASAADTSSTAAVSVSQTATVVNSQAGSSVGLIPPPFFSWPQTSDSLTNVSYATVQASQNMMWSTAYQHPQAQYTPLAYYQPQNYGSAFSGAQAYQAQFSVLQPSAVPLKMAQPPLPPPPPPPPSNPPLPPSVPLLPNPTMSLFPNSQPPPPPPPLP